MVKQGPGGGKSEKNGATWSPRRENEQSSDTLWETGGMDHQVCIGVLKASPFPF